MSDPHHDRSDIDWDQAVRLIRGSKFGKSRLVPLYPTRIQALAEFAALCDELQRFGTVRGRADGGT